MYCCNSANEHSVSPPAKEHYVAVPAPLIDWDSNSLQTIVTVSS